MKQLFTYTIFILSTNYAASQQLDYMKMRDTICPPICGWRDSVDLVEIIPKMLNIDVTTLKTKSRSEFFDDLASCEYQLFCRTGEKKMIRGSAFHHSLSAQYDPENYSAFWNAAFSYYLMSDFSQMEYYLQLYELRTPKKFRDDAWKKKIDHLKVEARKSLISN